LDKITAILAIAKVRDNLSISELHFNQITKTINNIIQLTKEFNNYIKVDHGIKLEDLVKRSDLNLSYAYPIYAQKLNLSQVEDCITLEILKERSLQQVYPKEPTRLPKKFNCNLTLKYGMKIVKSGTLDTILGKNITFESLGKAAKEKRINIIALKRKTNVVFDSLKLIDIGKVGLNSNILYNLNTIIKTKPVDGEDALLFNSKGEKCDLLSTRYIYKILEYNEIINGKFIIIDTFDYINYRVLETDTIQILHLLNGINYGISYPYIINKKIIEHIVPLKDYQFEQIHTPIAHLRNTIKNKIEIKDIGKIKEYLRDKIYDIIKDALFTEYYRLAKEYDDIIIRETKMTFLSKCESYIKKIIRVLNFELEKITVREISDFYEVLDKALSGVITEKDNPYDILQEKRFLFNYS